MLYAHRSDGDAQEAITKRGPREEAAVIAMLLAWSCLREGGQGGDQRDDQRGDQHEAGGH